MSAVLADPTSSFHANLQLPSGASAHITAPSLVVLSSIVALLQGTTAANDGGTAAPGKSSKPAATAAGTPAATPTAAPSAQPAAAPAAKGEAGNVTTASPAAAPTASSSAGSASSEVNFDVLKKAFLALSTKTDGRAKCEAVLKPLSLAKLSEATPDQYPALLKAIEEASK